MAEETVEYVYLDEYNQGNEVQLCQMNGERIVVVGPDGKLIDAQLVEGADGGEYFVEDQQLLVGDEDCAEVEEIEQTTGDYSEGVEVVETVDSVGGDMKFVMVNQQEVLVVRNNNNNANRILHQQRRIPLMNQEKRVMKRRKTTPQSVKKGPKLIQDFLLPHLDNETFGHLLRWVDRQNGQFAMNWSHKNGADWKVEDCAVYREWDRIKERVVREEQGYWMEAKQRFRAALAKVSVQCSSDREDLKSSRIFQIKWTRETRAEILDQVYTSSKYFEMPPRLSYGQQEIVTMTPSNPDKFYIDGDFTQEVIVGAQEDTMSADDREDHEETQFESVDIVEEVVFGEDIVN